MINPLAAYLNASTLLGILSFAVASQVLFAQTAGGENPGPWSPDNGDGTYKNPIIFADYSDPDVLQRPRRRSRARIRRCGLVQVRLVILNYKAGQSVPIHFLLRALRAFAVISPRSFTAKARRARRNTETECSANLL
jgi:hypothetical protein